MSWCTVDGGYGITWQVAMGTFDDYANNNTGLNAVQACCGCGGGVKVCNDMPNWASSTGSTCDDFVGRGWCTENGTYGPAWEPIWGTFETWKNRLSGLSAVAACCGCGGGSTLAA